MNMHSNFRTAHPRVFARGAPIALAPSRPDVAAYTIPGAFERWTAGVKVATDPAATNVITIYDVIGEDFWTGGGVTVNRIDAALRKIGNQAVEVHINSPGGDMFEGIAIYNRLLEHPADVTVKVMGLAASAASVIAMAGAEVQIGAAAFLMIHNCWVLAVGDRHDMTDCAAYLTPFDAAMAGVYAEASGNTVEECAAWMDAETWMNGAEAVAKGFADTLLSAADMQEDEATSEQARSASALRLSEIALRRSGCTRADARGLLNRIKGMSGAAPEDRMSGAADTSWLGSAADLVKSLKS